MDTPSLPALPLPSSSGSSASTDEGAMQVALDGARRVLQRRFRVLYLIRDAYERLAEHKRPVASIQEDLSVLLRMMKAWALRRYEHIPWTPLLLTTGAVVYFVTPTDLIPDVLFGIGFVDDVTVVSTVVQSVRNELQRFRQWEALQTTPLPNGQDQ